jgi:endonuclease-8
MEGPSLVILTEEASKFTGLKVKKAGGNSKLIKIKTLKGQKIKDLRSWGKHFLMTFEKEILRVHFLLFGSYAIDKPKPGRSPRLSLQFKTGRIDFYACSIRPVAEPLDKIYDWRADVMSPSWDENLALEKLNSEADVFVCDAILNQEIFAGAGNIIKNEVLYRLGFHPLVKLNDLSLEELRLIAREVRLYSLQFYLWKKQFVLRKNWQIMRKKYCPRCDSKTILVQAGKTKRRTFYCPKCQKKVRKPAAGKSAKIVKERLSETARLITSNWKKIRASVLSASSEKEH